MGILLADHVPLVLAYHSFILSQSSGPGEAPASTINASRPGYRSPVNRDCSDRFRISRHGFYGHCAQLLLQSMNFTAARTCGPQLCELMFAALTEGPISNDSNHWWLEVGQQRLVLVKGHRLGSLPGSCRRASSHAETALVWSKPSWRKEERTIINA